MTSTVVSVSSSLKTATTLSVHGFFSAIMPPFVGGSYVAVAATSAVVSMTAGSVTASVVVTSMAARASATAASVTVTTSVVFLTYECDSFARTDAAASAVL